MAQTRFFKSCIVLCIPLMERKYQGQKKHNWSMLLSWLFLGTRAALRVLVTGQSIPEAALIYARYWTDIWLPPDSRGRYKWLRASFTHSSDESISAKSENLALKYTNYNNNILGQKNK